ncbi:hypothetical protein MMMIC1C10_10820 [Methanococcus maripaludis]|jgi:positive regulator of sigma E activity
MKKSENLFENLIVKLSKLTIKASCSNCSNKNSCICSKGAFKR